MPDPESPVSALLPQLSDTRSPALRSDPVLCDDPLSPAPVLESAATLAAAEAGMPEQIVQQHKNRGTVGQYLGQNHPAAATMAQAEADISMIDSMIFECREITKLGSLDAHDPEIRVYYMKLITTLLQQKRGLMGLKLKMISDSSAPATDGKRKARGPLMKGPIHLHQHQHPKS